MGLYNADLKKFVATVQPTPCPAPARCVGKITVGDQAYATCSPAAPATYREGDLLFVKRSGEDLPFVLVSNPDGRAMTGRSYQNEPEKFGADDVVGRYCASASPSTSANPAPTSAVSAETAAASANLSCEVTKRTHTCQAAAGPMLACTATSRLPWERKVVNGAFNLLSTTKPAVDACGKVAGGQGTYVVSGLVDDPQTGPRMNMKPKKGFGPTADCLAKALSFTLPAAPRGDDDPPASLTLNYALDVTVDCGK